MGVPFYDTFRFKLVMAGERAGKSFSGACYAFCHYNYTRYIKQKDTQLIWCVAQDYEQAYEEFRVFADLLEQSGQIVRGRDVNVREEGRDRCTITVFDEPGNHGSPVRLRVETITGGNPQKIARVAPDGIVGCEVALWTEVLWHRVLARLGQKRGWFWGSGSFESSTDWLAGVWQAWQSQENARSYDIASWSNRSVYPGGRQDSEILRLERDLPPYLFSERVMGRPAKPQGAVYPDATVERHVAPQFYNPNYPVEVWVDPGYAGGYAVLAAQIYGDHVRIIDEVYERGWTHDEMIDEMRTRKWGQSVVSGVADRAVRQHPGDRSALEVWSARGIRLRWKSVPLVDGIIRVHSILRSDGTELPQLVIDPRCQGLLSELGLGRPKWKDAGPWRYKLDRDNAVVSEVPEPRNNHACSALAYGLVDNFGFVIREVPDEPVSWYNNNGPSWLKWAYGEGKREKERREARRFFGRDL